MGYQQGTMCYPTALAAAQAAAAENNGRAMTTGNPPRVTFLHAKEVTESQITYTVQTTAAGVHIVYPVPYHPVACQKIEASDAAALAWAVVGCWAAAFGFRLVMQVLR